MKLLNKKILVTAIKEDPVSSSGIILNSSPETFRKGIVEHSGSEFVEAGQTVLYSQGHECVIDGKEYVLVDEVSVLVCLN